MLQKILRVPKEMVKCHESYSTGKIDYEQMMKDSAELQAFCQSVKTADEAMECLRRSQEFQKKWGSVQSL
jgi:hypothetical protein